LVVTPAISISASAWRRRASADKRLGPRTISLAIIGSYQGVICAPGSTPVSTRTFVLSAGKAR
jgi:hypothetical protein